MITAEAQQYIDDNGLDNELYDIVCEWLIENSHIEPNFLDYSEIDLNEYLQKISQKIYGMIETLILLGCLYLSILVTDYVEKQKQ